MKSPEEVIPGIRQPTDPVCAYCGQMLGTAHLAFLEDENDPRRPRAIEHIPCMNDDPLIRLLRSLSRKGPAGVARARELLPVMLRWMARRGRGRVSFYVRTRRGLAAKRRSEHASSSRREEPKR